MSLRSSFRALFAAAALALAAPGLAGTLDEVTARGTLECGVSEGIPGFSRRDPAGAWSGLDVDFCRAVAAAVLGDAARVSFRALGARERFEALKSGAVDLLARNSTWTVGREIEHGIQFVGVNYFDGQGLMARRSLGARSALGLDGASVCVKRGTTSEVNVAEYFEANRMRVTLVPVDDGDALVAAFDAGRCDVATSDQSQLYGLRTLLADPGAAVVLPEFISKEPLGPAVRAGDTRWLFVVRAVLALMINAEEERVSSANLDRVRSVAETPPVRRLLDLDGDLAGRLGLAPGWAERVIGQVGNYAQSFERNLGKTTPLRVRRSQNALWNDGGLLYAPPMR